jgi:hypothetical protein
MRRASALPINSILGTMTIRSLSQRRSNASASPRRCDSFHTFSKCNNSASSDGGTLRLAGSCAGTVESKPARTNTAPGKKDRFNNMIDSYPRHSFGTSLERSFRSAGFVGTKSKAHPKRTPVSRSGRAYYFSNARPWSYFNEFFRRRGMVERPAPYHSSFVIRHSSFVIPHSWRALARQPFFSTARSFRTSSLCATGLTCR